MLLLLLLLLKNLFLLQGFPFRRRVWLLLWLWMVLLYQHVLVVV